MQLLTIAVKMHSDLEEELMKRPVDVSGHIFVKIKQETGSM